MRGFIAAALLTLALAVPASAAEVPDELWRALPEGAEEILRDTDLNAADPLGSGVSQIVERIARQGREAVSQRLRGAVGVLLAAALCGAADGFSQSAGASGPRLVNTAGALSVTLLTAGSLETLIGMGGEAIRGLNDFGGALLPVLAAASAVSGSVTAASVQQVIAVLFTGALLRLIEGTLLPLVYLYIALLTASSCLPGGRLGGVAEALRKCVTWVLCGALTVFTLYLTTAKIIAGTADAAAVKLAKTAVSGAIPVVGGIVAEAAEAVLTGAGLLKNAVGVFGLVAVLAACAWPFFHLAVQYLLYKLAGFLAGMLAPAELCRLIDGLGGAFGLVLGMTGAGALALLISILSSMAAVT